MSQDQARRAALRLFGNPDVVKEETLDTCCWTRLEQFARAVRNGARSLWRTPRFAVTAVVVMALGIGATTALFHRGAIRIAGAAAVSKNQHSCFVSMSI